MVSPVHKYKTPTVTSYDGLQYQSELIIDVIILPPF